MPLNQPQLQLLRLQETADGRQALFTASPIKPGQIVLVDTPVVVYPSSLDCFRIFCCCCFRVLPSKPLHCSNCYQACFCSAQCLRQSHPHLICHAMPKLVVSTNPWHDDILFLLAAYSLPTSGLLQLLPPHSHSSSPDESIEQLHSELATLVKGQDVSMFTCGNTSALISKRKNNSFALKIPKNSKYESCGVTEARAYGLYLWASKHNLNCIPNVCRFNYVDNPNRQDNTSFVFKAVDEIKEGLEIFTSYVGVAMGYKERQNRLIEAYGIRCDCTRCNIESQWKENKGGEEGNEETYEEETTKGIKEMNKEEYTDRNKEEGTDKETEEETEEQTEEMDGEDSEENNEEDTEEETEEINEEESE